MLIDKRRDALWLPPLVFGVLCLLVVAMDLPSESPVIDPVLGVLDGWPAHSGATRVYWLVALLAGCVLFLVRAGYPAKVVAARTVLLMLGVVALSLLDLMAESSFASDLAKAAVVVGLGAIGLLWARRFRVFALWGLAFSVAVLVLVLVDGPRVPLLIVTALAVLSWRARGPWLALVAAAFLCCVWMWGGAELSADLLGPGEDFTYSAVYQVPMDGVWVADWDAGTFGVGYTAEPFFWDADEVLVPGLVLLMAGLYRLVVRRRGGATGEVVLFGAGLTALTVALAEVIASHNHPAHRIVHSLNTDPDIAFYSASGAPLLSSPASGTVLVAAALGVGLGVWAWLRRDALVGTTTAAFLATLWFAQGSTEFFALVTPASVLLIGAALIVLKRPDNSRDNSAWRV